MAITGTDIKNVQIALNQERTGDTCSLALSNKNGKYQVSDSNFFLMKGYRLYGGYKDSYVSLFTGFMFSSEEGFGKLPNEMSADILERTVFAEKINTIAYALHFYTVEEIVRYYAALLGFADEEILVTGDWSYILMNFWIDNEPVLQALNNLAEYFGGKLYLNSDGYLVLEKLYVKETPDITYSRALIQDYRRSVTPMNNINSYWYVEGGEKPGSESWSLDTVTIKLGSYLYTPTLSVNKKQKQDVLDDSPSDDFLMDYLGETYTPSSSSFNFTPPVEDFLLDFSIPEEKIVTLDTGVLAIPTEVYIWKVNNPGLSNPSYVPSTEITVSIIAWNDTSITLEITPPSGATAGYTNYIYKILVVGKKLIKTESKASKYNASVTDWDKAIFYGFTKARRESIPYLSTDGEVLQVSLDLWQLDRYKTYRVKAVVPFNPLIERSDLVRLQLAAGNVDFYVEEISHSFGQGFKSTILSGYQRYQVSWLGVGITNGVGAQSSWNTLQSNYGTWNNIP